MSDDRLLLGIDVGTSVVKCVLFDTHGREVAVARRESPVERPHPNWSEANMDTVWDRVVETLREVAAAGRGAHVAAVGITGTCCGAWLVDAAGRPLRTAILWNDGRAADIVDEWQRSGLLSRISPSPATPSSPATRCRF